uniref:Uncharacterized protein n=1 Tax=Rhizophora mucronata TaxID=61149 RepID=A0A2P2P6U5_RHIMU
MKIESNLISGKVRLIIRLNRTLC